MDCAQNGDPPPSELSIAWGCQRWGTMPDAGGYFDQDYKLMRLMVIASNVYDTVAHMRNLPAKRIHELSESERRILRLLTDEGLIFNG